MANCNMNGYAPYNFVSYMPRVIVPPVAGEERKWSGRIICELTALTPILVAGRHENSNEVASVCKFMQIGGQKYIQGSSIKGMLRSLVEILSFSGMRPMNRAKLFWRDITARNYLDKFATPRKDAGGRDLILGGYLRQHGADFTLTPVAVEKKPAKNCEKVETGAKVGKDRRPNYYYFHKPEVKPVPVNRDIVYRLWDQMTEDQNKRWPEKKRRERLRSDPGLPVFYRVNSAWALQELGFCRYFRIQYDYSPYDLAWPEVERREAGDMARSIFGHVGEKSVRGRVAVESFPITGSEYAPNGLDVVMGGPKPTCVPFYVRQDPAKVQLRRKVNANKRSSMADYNELTSRLRGRKLYWHQDPDVKHMPPGNGNKNVMTRLHPLAAGAKGQFIIHARSLADTELGCLFEALELLPGCAHKIGMGKGLGLGSARIAIKAAEISADGGKYASLAARLAPGVPPAMDKAQRDALREKFRAHILAAVRQLSAGMGGNSYYELPPIKQLYLMLNWDKRLPREKLRYMPLDEFKHLPLLPEPEQVK